MLSHNAVAPDVNYKDLMQLFNYKVLDLMH